MRIGRFHSKIATNSFAGMEMAAALPYKPLNLPLVFPKPIYNYTTYHLLSNNGAGSATNSRTARWNRLNGVVPTFETP